MTCFYGNRHKKISNIHGSARVTDGLGLYGAITDLDRAIVLIDGLR